MDLVEATTLLLSHWI